ncbi:MAG TPA: alpha/beta hydrolase, partial [Telluria sp.]|nr:alpha/beta hydrolase [Telluria sp.]
RNDPWLAAGDGPRWAERWGSEFVDAGAAGHINADSGLGDWLFGLAQLQRLALRADRRRPREGRTRATGSLPLPLHAS